MKHLFRTIVAIVAAIICSCSQPSVDTEKIKPDIDRFALQFRDINEIAIVTRLTDLGRDTTPHFSPAGDRIYFVRLFPSSDSTEESYLNGIFGIDYKSGQLYLLESQPPVFLPPILEPDSLPTINAEIALFGYRCQNSLYFTTERKDAQRTRVIYKQANDSLVQLTYGPRTAYLKGVSANGKYLAFSYGNEYLSTVILDNQTGLYYAVPKDESDSTRNDFSAKFSPDDRYLVFIRSGELYAKKIAPCGDLWLIEFKSFDDE